MKGKHTTRRSLTEAPGEMPGANMPRIRKPKAHKPKLNNLAVAGANFPGLTLHLALMDWLRSDLTMAELEQAGFTVMTLPEFMCYEGDRAVVAFNLRDDTLWARWFVRSDFHSYNWPMAGMPGASNVINPGMWITRWGGGWVTDDYLRTVIHTVRVETLRYHDQLTTLADAERQRLKPLARIIKSWVDLEWLLHWRGKLPEPKRHHSDDQHVIALGLALELMGKKYEFKATTLQEFRDEVDSLLGREKRPQVRISVEARDRFTAALQAMAGALGDGVMQGVAASIAADQLTRALGQLSEIGVNPLLPPDPPPPPDPPVPAALDGARLGSARLWAHEYSEPYDIGRVRVTDATRRWVSHAIDRYRRNWPMGMPRPNLAELGGPYNPNDMHVVAIDVPGDRTLISLMGDHYLVPNNEIGALARWAETAFRVSLMPQGVPAWRQAALQHNRAHNRQIHITWDDPQTDPPDDHDPPEPDDPAIYGNPF